MSTATRSVTARAEFVPGGMVGRHTHFGEEIGYVIEGVLTVEINGVSKEVKTGEAFTIPAGAPHNATNAGAGPAAILATYIVEKEKPQSCGHSRSSQRVQQLLRLVGADAEARAVPQLQLHGIESPHVPQPAMVDVTHTDTVEQRVAHDSR